MTTEEVVDALEAAMNKMLDAADLLQPFYEDPEVRSVIAELEGSYHAWNGPMEGPGRLSFDVLLDRILAIGTREAFTRR